MATTNNQPKGAIALTIALLLGLGVIVVGNQAKLQQQQSQATTTTTSSTTTTTSGGTTTTSTSTTTTTTVPGSTDGNFARFGDTRASWNQPVSVYGPATGTLAMYKNRFWSFAGHPAAPGVTNVQFKDYSIPTYDLRTANTTARIFQYTAAQAIGGLSATGVVIGQTIPWNTSWVPGTGNDRLMSMINPDTGETWELGGIGEPAINCFDLFGPNGAAGFDINNPLHLCGYGANYYTTLYTQKDGSTIVGRGMGITKQMLITRAVEVESGVIRHALSLTISSTMFGQPTCSPAKGTSATGAGSTCGFYVAPATRVEWAQDPTQRCGSTYASVNAPTQANRERTVPEGLRLAINITDTEITTWLDSRGYTGAKRETARIFAVALRDYGAIIAETGCFGIGIETDGLIGPSATTALWAENGITDTGGGNPHGDLLSGLITQARLYVVNPPPGL